MIHFLKKYQTKMHPDYIQISARKRTNTPGNSAEAPPLERVARKIFVTIRSARPNWSTGFVVSRKRSRRPRRAAMRTVFPPCQLTVTMSVVD